MDVFELSEVIAAHRAAGRLYHEFFAVPGMSMGLYVLPAGEADPQSPHTEDEVYYVTGGRGMVRVDGEDRPISAGSIVFVGEAVSHHFHTITEDLILLVVFAPRRGSRAGGG